MKIPYYNFSENLIKKLDIDTALIETAIIAAANLADDHDNEALVAGGMYVDNGIENRDQLANTFARDKVSSSGGHFLIPLAVPEQISSGDERSFKDNSLSIRDLPLPLMWQIKTASGHDGSVVVGRIDTLERVEGGVGNARGVFDVGIFGREAERLVRGGFLRGVSVDLDKFSASEQPDPQEETDLTENSELDANSEPDNKPKPIKNKKIVVDSARVMGITIVAKPAFQESKIMMEEEPSLSSVEDYLVDDGVYEDALDEMDYEYAALAASAAPIVPPSEWFSNPDLNELTPLTITDDGKVFGHIASWKTDHIGLPRATKPPRSASNYAFFRTGVVRADNGKDIPVGQLTLAGGHAPLQASARDAVKHYDDTASAVADVSAGEDRHGIWVSGALRPDVTPIQVRALRASSPSGDWRSIQGRMELVAVCQVNVPGFPVARSIVAGGQIQALVAAGAAPIAELRQIAQESLIEQRLFALEQKEFAKKRDEAINRMKDASEEYHQNLQSMVASAEARMADSLAEKKANLEKLYKETLERFNN